MRIEVLLALSFLLVIAALMSVVVLAVGRILMLQAAAAERSAMAEPALGSWIVDPGAADVDRPPNLAYAHYEADVGHTFPPFPAPLDPYMALDHAYPDRSEDEDDMPTTLYHTDEQAIVEALFEHED